MRISPSRVRTGWFSVTAIIFSVVSFAAISAAQQGHSIDEYARSVLGAHQFRQAAISPDGTRIAWVERLQDEKRAPSGHSAIWVTGTEKSSPIRRITAAAEHAEHSLAWSHDSQNIAFLSDAAKAGQFQLYVATVSDGRTRQLTHTQGFLADPRWSPDGKAIGVLLTENSARAVGPTEPKASPVGAVDEKVDEQRLATVDVQSGAVKLLSPANLYIYEYDWSPDGKRLVTTAARGSGDNNWYIAQLYMIDAGTGDAASIYRPPLQIAVPRWSPDGSSIAFIMGLMSDEGITGGDVFVLRAAGGEPRNLTPDVTASAVWLAWMPSSKQLVVGEVQDGSSALTTLDIESGNRQALVIAPEIITNGLWGTSFSLAENGRSAGVIRHSFQTPPEVWAGPIGKWRQVTNANQSVKAQWGESKSIHWDNDGMQIQGWLIYPPQYDATKRYPLAVWVHGGPGRSLLSHWPSWDNVTSYVMDLPAKGYFVLFPNVRGSFGQGEKFQAANVKDIGYGDFRDLVAGVDAVEKSVPVDSQRVGLAGWSYGGYMSMWAVTQTQRFHAVMAGAGIANWQSYYGENQIDEWLIPFFGASVYADPAIYARSAPINFVQNVKTPTLVMVGELDGECPVPQSLEFWHALKTLGVATQLVVYPGEGHAIAQTDHRVDIITRLADWFDRYLKPAANDAR
jgi:dipeptidyl aminopeptidase/acylaminoacyl peptidase